ncbi:hypothetical protein HMPREF9096_01445, partial [Haemophilus sp. oral taxon 851 str. F0397]
EILCRFFYSESAVIFRLISRHYVAVAQRFNALFLLHFLIFSIKGKNNQWRNQNQS